MKQKVLSALLTLCMIVTLLPAMGTAQAAQEVAIYVGTAKLTNTTLYTTDGQSAETDPGEGSRGENYALFDPQNGTLTLHNFSYSGAGHTDSPVNSSAAIYNRTGKLTVKLEGGNNVTHASGSNVSYGVYCGDDLTIDGDGVLIANGGDASMESCGIYGSTTVTFSGGTVIANGGTATSGDSSGIKAADVSISGSTVTANGGTASNASKNSYGIEAGSVNISSGTVIANGGNVGASSSGSAVTIPGLSDPSVGLTPQILSGKSCGIYATGSVAFSGGVTVARAGARWDTGSSAYIYNNMLRYAVYCGTDNGISLTYTQIAGAVKNTGDTAELFTDTPNYGGKTITDGAATATGVVIVPNSGWAVSKRDNALELKSISDMPINYTSENKTYSLSSNYAIVTADATALSVTGGNTLSVPEDKTLVAVSLAENSNSTIGISSSVSSLKLTGGGKVIAVGGLMQSTGDPSSIGLSGNFSVDNITLTAYGSKQALSTAPSSIDNAVAVAPAGVARENLADANYKLVSIVPGYPIALDGSCRLAPTTSWTADGNYSSTLSADSDGNYVINTPADLAAFAKTLNSGTGLDSARLILTADLDMSAHSWTPIGGSNAFAGTFDGGGHTISGLYYNGDAGYVGLFGCVENGTVKNVNVTNSHLHSNVNGVVIGGVVGRNSGNGSSAAVINCHSSATVFASTPSGNGPSQSCYAGGVVGYNVADGIASVAAVTGCSSSGSVAASIPVGMYYCNSHAGGVVGINFGSSSGIAAVSDCSYSGSVAASALANENSCNSYAGGVVGYNYGVRSGGNGSVGIAAVTNCCNSGSVSAAVKDSSGNVNYAGGMVGYNLDYNGGSAAVTNCYSSGISSVSASNGQNSYAGGVVGNSRHFNGNNGAAVKNCYNAGSVSGTTSGGVAGKNDEGSSVTNCYYLDTCASFGVGDYSGTGTTTELPDDQMKAAANATNDSWTEITVTDSDPEIAAMKKSLVDALNAGAAVYNSTDPAPAVQAVRWKVLNANTYPVLGHAITVTSPANGTATIKVGDAGVNSAFSGETVTVTAAPNGGYALGEITVTRTDGTETVAVTNGAFTMPNYPVTVTATFDSAFSVTFNANGHGTAPAEQMVTSDGKAAAPASPTADGYTFGGWYKEAACTNAWSFGTDTVTANTTLYAKWTSNPGGGSGGGGTTTPTTPAAPVIVGGKSENIGKTETTTTETKVTVDSGKLTEKVDSAETGASVVVPVSDDKTTATAQLVVKNVEDMAEKQMTLEVQTGGVSYELPTAAVDTKALMDELGAQDATKVPVSVTIKQLDESDVTIEDGTLMLPPIEFTVTASYGGKTAEVETFQSYVKRIVELPEGVDYGKITTAVVVENGTERHVPTEVFQKNGKWYARVNSLTNSVYAFIYNEAEFADAAGEWFEAAVNEAASRRIVSGRSEDVFDGAAPITRAEFAAIAVRALGLPATGKASFTDVSDADWFSGAVGAAAEHGLITGYSDGSFEPEKQITRQEAMVIIQRAAAVADFSSDNVSVQGFKDLEQVQDWALAAVNFNVANGLIVGSDGALRPNDSISRAETATVILRLLQKAELIDVRTKL